MACEISTADELTLTELMFSGALKDVTVEEMVALLSCFVWQEKLQDAQKPREELDLLFSQLQDTARRVANIQLECKVQKLFLSFYFLASCSNEYSATEVQLILILVVCLILNMSANLVS